MDKFWAHLIKVQPDPDPWVVVVSALVALVIVGFRMPWQVSRGLITIAHEGGHALMALLTRRKLEGIRLHSDTSGVTLTRGRPTGPGMVLTALAGYLAPPLLGLGAAWLTEQGRITLLVWGVLLLLVCMLLLIRNLYGALILLVTGGAVFALIMYARLTSSRSWPWSRCGSCSSAGSGRSSSCSTSGADGRRETPTPTSSRG